LIQLKDLLNYKIQAQDGSFGRVSDVVFDRNGNIQYLLGSYQGQTFALPYMASEFSGAPNTLTFNQPIATLEQLRVDTNTLPSLQNRAFVDRMRQIFGQSFGTNQNMAAYPPTNNQTGIGTGTAGTGTGTTTGSGSTGAGGTGSTGTTRSGSAGTGTSGTGTGTTGTGTTGSNTTPGRAGQNNDNWNWPANPAGIVPGTGNGRFTTPPGTPRGRGTGTGTGTRNGTGTGTTGTGTGTSGTGTSGSGTGTTGGTGSGGTSGTSGSGTSGSGTSGSGGSGTTGSGS